MPTQFLVIKLRHHGDVLLTTALFRALKAHFPASEVHALVYKETTPLLDNNPHLSNVLTINRSLKGWSRLKAEWRLLRQIRRTRYDAVIHLTDQWIGALIARTSGAPKRIEYFYPKRNNAFWHRSFTDCIEPPNRGTAHAVELNLLCMRALGIDPQTIQGQMALEPTQFSLQSVGQRLDEAGVSRNFVLIHPAARWPFKCWEDEKFAEVVAYLLNQGLDVVLTCAPDEVEKTMTLNIEQQARLRVTQQVRGLDPDFKLGRLVNWGGQVSLPWVAALLKKCRFYLGVDSAPMHMAAALDVPQVALFGPSWVAEWRPWSAEAEVIWAGDFGPLPHPDSINTDDTTRLLAAIPTQAVLAAVNRLIARTDPPTAK